MEDIESATVDHIVFDTYAYAFLGMRMLSWVAEFADLLRC